MKRNDRRFGTAAVFGLLLVTLTHTAFACPVCRTTTGKQVRAGIFNGHFGANLVLILLPFPLFIGFVMLAHYGLPKWRR